MRRALGLAILADLGNWAIARIRETCKIQGSSLIICLHFLLAMLPFQGNFVSDFSIRRKQLEPRQKNQEMRALMALKNTIGLTAMGCQFERGLTGGVCVTFANEGIGAWWYQDERFNFASKAYSKPEYSAGSIEQVISATGSVVAFRPAPAH